MLHRVFAILVVFSLYLSLVSGHAHLLTPAAFNPASSKTASCGIAAGAPNPLKAPVAVWPQGTQQTITWEVVAADGVGALKMFMDPAGGITATANNIGKNGILPINFVLAAGASTVPA